MINVGQAYQFKVEPRNCIRIAAVVHTESCGAVAILEDGFQVIPVHHATFLETDYTEISNKAWRIHLANARNQREKALEAAAEASDQRPLRTFDPDRA